MAERTAGGSVNAVEVRHHDEPLVSIVVVTYGTGPIVLDCLDRDRRQHRDPVRGDRRRQPAGVTWR